MYINSALGTQNVDLLLSSTFVVDTEGICCSPQALQRQVSKLQLVIQDLQADAGARARESSDCLLKLKLENERHCASLVRQLEGTSEQVHLYLSLCCHIHLCDEFFLGCHR